MRSQPSTRCATGRPTPAGRRWTASPAWSSRLRRTRGPRCAAGSPRLPAQRPDAASLAALPRLAADVGTASDAVRTAIGRATGLTDRRAELAGRFGAYRAKALRLGASDDPRVVALTTQIRGLLATPRTDLPALTRALVAYQERVNEAEGRPA